MSIASMPVGQAPDQVLQQAIMGMVPDIKPYEALTELHNRVKNKSMAMAMQGNNAIQQAQQIQQQPPIAAQILQANNAMEQGIGALPVPTSNAYSGGGIVAFSNGGQTPASGASFIDRLPEGSIARKLREWVRAGRPALDKPLLDMLLSGRDARSDDSLSAPDPLIPTEYLSTMPEVSIPIPEVTVDSVATPPPAPTPASAATASPQARAAGPATRSGMPAWPQTRAAVPQLTLPEQRSSAELRAEDEAQAAPRLSAYDERMKRFRDRAEALKRGEGVRDPSRLERGLGGFMSGAADEVAAARRAGVRPSLGMALAGAARSARAEDKERSSLRREMEEKGYQLEMTLEAQRNAYERGEYELANRYGESARRQAGDLNAVKNRQAELEAAARNTDIARDEARAMRERQEVSEREKIASQERIAAAAREARSAAGDTADMRIRLANAKADPDYIKAIETIKRNEPMLGRSDQNSTYVRNARANTEAAILQARQVLQRHGVSSIMEDPTLESAVQRTTGGASATPTQRALVEQYRR